MEHFFIYRIRLQNEQRQLGSANHHDSTQLFRENKLYIHYLLYDILFILKINNTIYINRTLERYMVAGIMPVVMFKIIGSG